MDLLIKNGCFPDFESRTLLKANIGIESGKISYIGSRNIDADNIINADKKIISPGFIDIHMHEENFASEGLKYIISRRMLEMGVTTALGGNCGIQYQRLTEFKKNLLDLGGAPINYAMLAGYNQCRYRLGIGRHETINEEQFNIIKNMLEAEMDQGAFGISFGIEYDPGITYEELKKVCNIIKDENKLIAAHYRNDCVQDIESINEMIRLQDEIIAKFQISHLSSCSAMGFMEESLNAINKAMDRDSRLNFDTYPYNAFSTTIGSEVFEEGCFEVWGKDYKDILLTTEPYKNVFCDKKVFEDARKNYPNMLAVAFVMNEDEVQKAVSNERGIIASDAILNKGCGHPRAAGTFPRVLGKYVREERTISMIDALKKMTKNPADRLNLKTKGRIEIDADADITIFNPITIIDKATWTELLPPVGIEYVIINGEVALKNSKIENDRLGKFINYA